MDISDESGSGYSSYDDSDVEEVACDQEDMVQNKQCRPQVAYKAKFQDADEHPQLLVEGASLGAVQPPDFVHRVAMHSDWYRATNSRPAYLSGPQMDAVILANQAHSQYFRQGRKRVRKGFLLGDGTGVGKGRQIAGVLYEAFLHRQAKKGQDTVAKAVFLTTSSTLFPQMEEELAIFFPKTLTIRKYESGRIKRRVVPGLNVLMTTYRSLLDAKKRVQLYKWLGDSFSQHIIFDEAHSAKSAFSTMKKSATGKRVLEIHQRFPLARVLYSTATGASELHHLLVYKRLNLYGKGTAFRTEDSFKEEMKKRSVGGLEYLAAKLKQEGLFIARQISFADVKVHVGQAETSQCNMDVFNMSADFWFLMLEYLTRCDMPTKEYTHEKDRFEKLKKDVNGGFFAGSLSFFSTLIVSSKLDYVESTARSALDTNKSVILGLLHTWEDRFKKFIVDPALCGWPFSSAGDILRSTMQLMNIPVGLPKAYLKTGHVLELWNRGYADDVLKRDKDDAWKLMELHTNGKEEQQRVKEFLKKNGITGSARELCEEMNSYPQNIVSEWPPYSVGSYLARDYPELRSPNNLWWDVAFVKNHLDGQRLSILFHNLVLLLPINPVDEITQRFRSGDVTHKIAEMTGRKNVYVNIPNTGRFEVKKKLSLLQEKDRFMSGRKLVAIISGAASTGVSLHADKDCQNRKRRVHITIELAYNAEFLIQQQGRSHRSNQRCSPFYVLVKSPLAGEIRLVSTVVRRLKTLGAICNGHALANPLTESLQSGDQSGYSASAIDEALNQMFSGTAAKYVANVLGLETKGSKYRSCDDKLLSHILNRILMMHNVEQDKFVDILRTKSLPAAGRRLYSGIIEFPAQCCDITLLKKWELADDYGFGACAFMFRHSRVMPWQEASLLSESGATFYYDKDMSIKLAAKITSSADDNMMEVDGDDHSTRTRYEIYSPSSRIPTLAPSISGRRISVERSVAVQEVWNATGRKFYNQPGCIHMVETGNCGVKGCKKGWGCSDVLVLTGWSEKLVSESQAYPLVMCSVHVQNEEPFVGILIEGKKVERLAKKFNLKQK